VPAVRLWLTFPLASLLLLRMPCLRADAQQLQAGVGSADVTRDEKGHGERRGTQSAALLHRAAQQATGKNTSDDTTIKEGGERLIREKQKSYVLRAGQ